MIRESIVITLREDGTAQIVPLGVREENGLIVLAPFAPSATLDNLRRTCTAVVNYTDDVKVFAGCLTGRYQWPTESAVKIEGRVLGGTLSHVELACVRAEEDELRPRFFCKKVFEQNHRPFSGMNRAKAAVLEAAILVSRLHMLPADKIERELEYLAIAIDKTAGPDELDAWGWLNQKISEYRRQA